MPYFGEKFHFRRIERVGFRNFDLQIKFSAFVRRIRRSGYFFPQICEWVVYKFYIDGTLRHLFWRKENDSTWLFEYINVTHHSYIARLKFSRQKNKTSKNVPR